MHLLELLEDESLHKLSTTSGEVSRIGVGRPLRMSLDHQPQLAQPARGEPIVAQLEEARSLLADSLTDSWVDKELTRSVLKYDGLREDQAALLVIKAYMLQLMLHLELDLSADILCPPLLYKAPVEGRGRCLAMAFVFLDQYHARSKMVGGTTLESAYGGVDAASQ